MLEQLCGLRGTALKRCSDYLTNRSQSVIVGESVSNSYPLCYGVPQGSNLGPVLFLIYTISVSNVVANHSGVDEHQYSDDLLLRVRFQPSTSPSTVITKESACLVLSSCLADVERTLLQYRLKENPNKRELLFVTARSRCQEDDGVPLTLAGWTVTPNSLVPYLGVSLDSCFTMEKQVDLVRRSAYHHLRLIRRTLDLLDLSSTKLLIQSLVVSRLEYCNSLLVGLPASFTQKLKRVQKSAARLVLLPRQ